MERLGRAGLYGADLVTLDTPRLVQRYNDCLLAIGREPTALERFHVDGKGWSPEIAEETQDPCYLSHEPANQMAIIVTPDQCGKPVYRPSRSFDRALMREYFARYGQEVADITTTHGMWLEIDLGLTHYQSPRDLLVVRSVVVRTHALGLMRAALEQQALVQEFGEPGQAWFDADLRERILASARTHGDLRFRHVGVPDMRFDARRVFHSRAFGGVFVFNPRRQRPGFLVFEDAEAMPGKRIEGAPDVYAVSDDALLDRLHEDGFVEVDLGRYQRYPEMLAEKWQYLVADLLCTADDGLDFFALSSAHRKQRLVALKDTAPAVIFELERLAQQFRNSPAAAAPLPTAELQRYLLHPAEGLDELECSVVWQLLCRVQPHDPLRLYEHDKCRFYEEYVRWPESKRNWAVNLIERGDGPQRHRERSA